MIYIASPYAHKCADTMEQRVESVEKYAAYLNADGKTAFSPIAHGHAIQKFLPERLRKCHRFWLNHDKEYLFKADEYHLLALPEWELSAGCKWEYETAKVLGLPCYIIFPTGDSYRPETMADKFSWFE